MIKQSTGEDWDNANISLSTAQPDIGGSAPQLGIHHIGFVRQRALAVPQLKCYSFDSEYDPTIEDCYSGDINMSVGQERFRAVPQELF